MKKQIGGFTIDRGQKKEKLVSTAKKRTNRMGIFDKKVKSLENQLEIMDTKLTIMEYYSEIEKQAMI